MKRFKFMLILILVLVFTSTIAIQSVMSQDTQTKPEIALVMKSLGAEFFKTMEEGAIRYQQKTNDFFLLPLGMENQTNIEQQVNIIENTIAKGVDAIVIAPADSRAVVPPLAKAIEAGIKVINIDVALAKDALEKHGIKGKVPYVGPDNVEASKKVGDLLAEKLGSGANVIILEGNPGALNAQQRTEGFKKSVEEYNLNLLAVHTAHWETEEAYSVTSNLLTAYPNVDGIMCGNDAMALGAYQAIKAAGKTEEVKLIGIDNDSAMQDLIKNGEALATVDQFSGQLAVYGIQYAIQAINGEEVKDRIRTPIEVITKEKLN